MNKQEEKAINQECFTNFENRFQARLAAVMPRYAGGDGGDSKVTGTSARYQCRVKIEYQKDLMGLLEEGMLMAVKNFKPAVAGADRYTLMEISRVWPEHFGLRGLSDHGYYPMQFEIIEQSEEDWQTDDKSTMMIQIDAIPINYDLIIKSDCTFEFAKGFSYPVVGSSVLLLNSEMINRMYNQKIAAQLGIDTAKTVEDARLDPRLGTIKMFEANKAKIPIYVDFEKLIRYHFGVFAFTGGGKSNLMSNVLRRIMLHTEKDSTKVVIFDISCEYAFLLLDLLADPAVKAKLVLEHRIDSLEQFFNSVVKPREYETYLRTKAGLQAVMDQGKLTFYTKPKQKIPTYGQMMEELEDQRKDSIGRPHYINAIDSIHDAIRVFVEANGLSENQEVNEEFVLHVAEVAQNAMETFKVNDKAGLYAWATTRITILGLFKKRAQNTDKATAGLTVEGIRQVLEEPGTNLVIISISDPYTIKELAIALTQDLLIRSKRRFMVKPQILLVFDEAQEFISAKEGGIDGKCSLARGNTASSRTQVRLRSLHRNTANCLLEH